jgi:hypothetical protein
LSLNFEALRNWRPFIKERRQRLENEQWRQAMKPPFSTRAINSQSVIALAGEKFRRLKPTALAAQTGKILLHSC